MTNNIYIALLEEGTAVWRPVEAEQVEDTTYRIIGTVPDNERWEFNPGDLVRCQECDFATSGRRLVAYARVQNTLLFPSSNTIP